MWDGLKLRKEKKDLLGGTKKRWKKYNCVVGKEEKTEERRKNWKARTNLTLKTYCIIQTCGRVCEQKWWQKLQNSIWSLEGWEFLQANTQLYSKGESQNIRNKHWNFTHWVTSLFIGFTWSCFFVILRSQTAALCTWHFEVTVAFSKEKSVQQFGTWISVLRQKHLYWLQLVEKNHT